jgi:hypothetical protein
VLNLHYAGSGIGGIVDIYYQNWKMRLLQSGRLVAAVQDLWNATWAQGASACVEAHPAVFVSVCMRECARARVCGCVRA